MTSSHELRATAETLRARFRERFEQTARFREDRALASELTELAGPLLDALAAVGGTPESLYSLHDAYALLTTLCRHAASRDATASVAVTLPEAIAFALFAVGIELGSDRTSELAIVAAEAYTAARDERATRALRLQAAQSQVAFRLAPRCCAIMLAGAHDEADLGPVLEGFARDLLRDDSASCLLDLSRLHPIDEELARALGRFCGQAVSLGVNVAVVSSSAALRAAFDSWSLAGPEITFFCEYDRAQRATLAAAGFELRSLRRWARLFLPAGSRLVR